MTTKPITSLFSVTNILFRQTQQVQTATCPLPLYINLYVLICEQLFKQ